MPTFSVIKQFDIFKHISSESLRIKAIFTHYFSYFLALWFSFEVLLNTFCSFVFSFSIDIYHFIGVTLFRRTPKSACSGKAYWKYYWRCSYRKKQLYYYRIQLFLIAQIRPSSVIGCCISRKVIFYFLKSIVHLIHVQRPIYSLNNMVFTFL